LTRAGRTGAFHESERGAVRLECEAQTGGAVSADGDAVLTGDQGGALQVGGDAGHIGHRGEGLLQGQRQRGAGPTGVVGPGVNPADTDIEALLGVGQ
jgi:hypothetical protein